MFVHVQVVRTDLAQMHSHITRTRVAQAQQGVPKLVRHPRVMSRPLPHSTLTSCTSSLSPTSPIFQSFSPTQSGPLSYDLYVHCDDPRRSDGITKSTTPTGYEPKLIAPEDLEPKKIELDRTVFNQSNQEKLDRRPEDEQQNL